LGVLGRNLNVLECSLGMLGCVLDVLGRSLGMLGCSAEAQSGPAVVTNPACYTRDATKLLVQLDVLCNVAV
jgi:hypothetical protein